MGERSLQKKQLILEKAKEVFVEKGFRDVTMKDIVDACEISRGGLYLYYANTEEIFLEVLAAESEKTEDVFSENVGENATAAEIFAVFLKEQKKEMLFKRNSLTKAVYEYYFEKKVPKKDNPLKLQFDAAVKIIERLIDAGIEAGEFYCEDTKGAARNIMYVLEGLKIASQTRGITEEMIDREVLYIMQGLVIDEE